MASNGVAAETSSPVSGDGLDPRSQNVHDSLPSLKSDKGLVAQLTDNPFFTAVRILLSCFGIKQALIYVQGFGLAGIGAALAFTQKGLRHGAALLKRRLLVDVEINVKDESYQWFLYWMTIHQQAQLTNTLSVANTLRGTLAKTQGVSVVERWLRRLTPGMRHLSIKTEKTDLPNGSLQTHFALVPGPGKHILRYKNAFLMVERMRETKSMDLQSGKPWETVTLTTLYSQRHIFEDIFLEAHQLVQKATEGKTIIYHPISTSWAKFGEPRRKREISSVILDQGIKERIVADVKDFLSSSKWYYDRGIPYRRGYLLHGPPGSGKTSYVRPCPQTHIAFFTDNEKASFRRWQASWITTLQCST